MLITCKILMSQAKPNIKVNPLLALGFCLFSLCQFWQKELYGNSVYNYSIKIFKENLYFKLMAFLQESVNDMSVKGLILNSVILIFWKLK